MIGFNSEFEHRQSKSPTAISLYAWDASSTASNNISLNSIDDDIYNIHLDSPRGSPLLLRTIKMSESASNSQCGQRFRLTSEEQKQSSLGSRATGNFAQSRRSLVFTTTHLLVLQILANPPNLSTPPLVVGQEKGFQSRFPFSTVFLELAIHPTNTILTLPFSSPFCQHWPRPKRPG